MNKFVKYLLKVIGLDFILIVLTFLVAALSPGIGFNNLGTAFIVILICFGIQIITGLIFLIDERKREIGKDLLLSAGIIILIGYSICSKF